MADRKKEAFDALRKPLPSLQGFDAQGKHRISDAFSESSFEGSGVDVEKFQVSFDTLGDDQKTGIYRGLAKGGTIAEAKKAVDEIVEAEKTSRSRRETTPEPPKAPGTDVPRKGAGVPEASLAPLPARQPAMVESKARPTDLSKSAAKIAKKSKYENRIPALRNAALELHKQQYGRMFADKRRQDQYSGEQMLRRRATIESMLEGVPEELREAKRAQFAGMSEEQLYSTANTEMARQALIGVTKDPEDQQRIAMAGSDAIEARLMTSKAAQQDLGKRQQAFYSGVGSRTEELREEAEVGFALQDSSGQLGKDLTKQRSDETGFRTGTNETRKSFEALDSKLERSGTPYTAKTKSDALTVHTMGRRYGFESKTMRGPEDVAKAKANMVFAEAMAGSRRGRDRQNFVKATAALQLGEQEQQKQLAAKGIDSKMVNAIGERLDATARALYGDREENRESLYDSFKGINTTAGLQSMAGLSVEVDEALGPDKESKSVPTIKRVMEQDSAVDSITEKATPKVDNRPPITKLDPKAAEAPKSSKPAAGTTKAPEAPKSSKPPAEAPKAASSARASTPSRDASAIVATLANRPREDIRTPSGSDASAERIRGLEAKLARIAPDDQAALS